jgi:hypothetical protein
MQHTGILYCNAPSLRFTAQLLCVGNVRTGQCGCGCSVLYTVVDCHTIPSLVQCALLAGAALLRRKSRDYLSPSDTVRLEDTAAECDYLPLSDTVRLEDTAAECVGAA